VVAGYREEVGSRRWRRPGQRGGVWTAKAVLVVLARRRWIDLVAAHDEHPPARQLGGTVAARELEALLSEQRRHRVGGVKAVAEVRDEVDPQRPVSAGAVLVGRRFDRRLHLALVRVGAKDARQDDAKRGIDQD